MSAHTQIRLRSVHVRTFSMLILMLGVGLLPTTTLAQAEIPDDTLIIALTDRPSSLDPAHVFRSVDNRVINNIFEGLYMPPAGEGDVVPAVATGHEVSDDGRMYTFSLRDDARWSNGDSVTAADFVHAWQRVVAPGSDSPYAYLMFAVANAQEVNSGSMSLDSLGVRAIDEHTLLVTLIEPVPFFIELTAFATFYPVHTASSQEHGDAAFEADHLIGNGPFRIASYDEDLQLVRNENYWDVGAVALRTMELQFFATEGAAMEAYLGGEVEWVGELPWDQLPELSGRADFHSHPMFGTYYFRVNVTDPSLADPRVRRALSLAIDRDALCVDVLDNRCQAAVSFVPPMPNFEPLGVLAYNPDRARELMLEAGFENGEGFPAIRVNFNTSDLHQRVVNAITAQWTENLGIEVEQVESDWDGFLEAVDMGDYHVARFGWIGDYLDPDTFLYLMESRNLDMNGGWANDAYDALLAQASVEQNQERRFDLYRGAEAILLNEVPIIPLFYYTQYHLISSRVTGLEMNLRDVHLGRYIEKTPAE